MNGLFCRYTAVGRRANGTRLTAMMAVRRFFIYKHSRPRRAGSFTRKSWPAPPQRGAEYVTR